MAAKNPPKARPVERTATTDAGADLLLLAISEGRAFPFPLASGSEIAVGSAADADLTLADPKLGPRHLLLRPRAGETLDVEDLNTANGSLLNDVQLSGRSTARIGDQISLGDSVLLVLRAPARAPVPPLIVSAAELDDRLQSESDRARQYRRPFSLLLLSSPAIKVGAGDALVAQLAREVGTACTWGRFGTHVRALLCPETSAQECARLKGTIASILGGEGHRFAIGYASFPEDGVDADSVLENALVRLSGQDPLRHPPLDEAVFLDPVMVRFLALIDRLARSTVPVLLQGERGVGKELLARILHQRSSRSAGPLVKVSGASLWGAEAENVLFGKPGAFETAAGGTLFIDALALLPLTSQARLARLLETRALARSAASTSAPVDAALITATEEDVAARVRAGMLREDLMAPLSRITLVVPPLRDRPSEILPLADLFLSRARRIHARPRLTLGGESRAMLQKYRWPGNVRELKNAIDRAAIASETDEIHPDALPPALLRALSPEESGETGTADLRSSLRGVERDALLKALGRTRWNVTEAARRLGLPRRTVVYRMSRLGLRRPRR